ncbi:hypothetical protein BCR36DRAFT_329337 [Piromyces finnis]|uniref:Bud22 domain-containing protein n=1 Tax=Piromyces finnis TaxID=1754191 RepID=A0A1Y1V892_9FUNG|nr:hypothetical protein BCR36DRAFT_329337 [Piromyces finnis]|eukprot:ORX48365.1 hypothetical protein BCR36DRAFT_329337 [Piromyces finnis]
MNNKKTNWFIEIKKLSEKLEKNEGDKDDILSQIFEIKQDKITGKIYHLKKELRKAIKKAKNFEIQKKIKKIKNIRSNETNKDEDSINNEIKKVEEQINQIKQLKLDEISDKFLYKSICEDEVLGKHSILTLYRTSNRPKDDESIENQNKDLINNILKANITKTCITNIINDIKKVIEVFDQNKIEKSVTLDDKPKPKNKKRKKKSKAKKQKTNADSMEFNSEDEDDNGLGVSNKNYDSMFMSSLNGGVDDYYSSDDDETNDIIEEKRPKKKNRMGQRERQKLWEKNFGKNANHLKKARELKLKEKKKEKTSKLPDNLHPSWEAKRLMKEKSKIVEFTGKKVTFDDDDDDNNNTNTNITTNKNLENKAKKAKELHPSWEAKKLKQLKEQAITNSGVKGTKIVFDDD